ncbi:hypothetical protein [Segatella oulorum]|uniref:hypothetical protein n=1 Tax=Segatella oulorum TaxID=28136 RepID=UPI003608D147
MRTNIFKMLCLAGAILLAACSSEENIEYNGKKVDVAKSVTFQFTEEGYQPGTFSTKTRAALPPQIVDLGNGLEAEMTLEPDSSCLAETRAGGTIISDGDYTIYALKDDGTRAPGGLTGHIAGGKFTPDNPANKWMLEPGKYTFVCYGPDVKSADPSIVDNGTGLDVVNGKNTMIGVTEHEITIGELSYAIPFEMKHLNARARLQVTSYTAPLKNGQFFMIPGTTAVNAKSVYDLKGNRLSTSPNHRAPQFGETGETTFETTPAYTPSDKTITYKAISKESLYYADGSSISMISNLNVSTVWFGSTLYGELLQAKLIDDTKIQSALNTVLKKNHSYIWNFKIRPSVLYLFSDGTVGTLGDKGTRTPIGVVVKEKTNSEEGTAMALKDVGNGARYTYTTPYNWAKMNMQHNTTHYTDANDAVNDMEGYKWTYETAGSVDGRIKANFEGDYTPFYKTARYTPGVTITGANVGKWYVLAFGEWAFAWKVLGNWDGNIPSAPGAPLTMSISTMNNAFTAAGGSAFQNYDYWCSTEYANEMRPTLNAGGAGFYIGLNATHNLDCYVRPFVHF